MKILHSSDWHLGQQFYGHSRLAEQRRFLAWLRIVICSLNIDVAVVCGDIFDTARPGYEAQQLWAEFAVFCAQNRVHLAAIAGNHDSAECLALHGQFGELSEFIHIAAAEDKIVVLDGVTLALAPFLKPESIKDLNDIGGYTQRHFANLSARAREIAPGSFVIGAGHLATQIYENPAENDAKNDAGNSAADADTAGVCAENPTKNPTQNPTENPAADAGSFFASNGPCTARRFDDFLAPARPNPFAQEGEKDIYIGYEAAVDAHSLGVFDYFALGHIHRACGRALRYCGSPLAMSFSERGAKSLSVILVDEPPCANAYAIGPRAQLGQVFVPDFARLVSLRAKSPADVDFTGFCGAYVRLICEQASAAASFSAYEAARAAGAKLCKIIASNADASGISEQIDSVENLSAAAVLREIAPDASEEILAEISRIEAQVLREFEANS